MNIGLVNIYSFRPHVEHLFYLATVLKNAGHKVEFLTCDSSVSTCYARQLKGNGRIVECSKCMLGGVRSYTSKNVSSISMTGKARIDLSPEVLDRLTLSSSCTLNRTESDGEWDDAEVLAVRRQLYQPVSKVVSAARHWIEENKIEGVICFNGRMELTRAITYACEQFRVPFITHERTWFGDGLVLTPNANCLSLRAVDKLVREYDAKPLTYYQAAYAAKLVAIRFLGKNTLEWRIYNTNASKTIWPIATALSRILILPSSRNEFAGEDDWVTPWKDNTQAIDDYLETFGIQAEQVLVRFHPNWAENIGKISGQRAIRLYRQWCDKRNIRYIASEEKASTYDLIQQADTVVLNGGSSAIEAGFCGKKVICLGPSEFKGAGFVTCYTSRSEMESMSRPPDLDAVERIRKTLRYVYVRANRHPQFVNFVKAIKTTEYYYLDGADHRRIIDLFNSGELVADDLSIADTEEEENKIIEIVRSKDWAGIAEFSNARAGNSDILRIRRRPVLRWLDGFRRFFPLGDRV